LSTGCWGEYFDIKREKVTGNWRRPYVEELFNFYSLLNTVRMVKLRISQAGLVAHLGEEIMCSPSGCWWETLKGRN
jgi:hypothetical protein